MWKLVPHSSAWRRSTVASLRLAGAGVAVVAVVALGVAASGATERPLASRAHASASQEGTAGSSRSPVLPASAHTAVGSTACRVCHRAVFRAWSEGPHAAAGEALARPEATAACADCHAPLSGTEDAVGCEACHGPGSAYADLAVMIDPLKRRGAGLWNASAVCASCHNAGHPFHVERDLEALAPRVHPAPPYRTTE